MWWNNDAVADNVWLFSESQLYAAAIDNVWRRQMAEVAIRLAGWSPFFVNFGKAKKIKVFMLYNWCMHVCVCVCVRVCACVCVSACACVHVYACLHAQKETYLPIIGCPECPHSF